MHSIRAKSCLKGFYLVDFPDQLWNFSSFNSFIQSKNGSFLAKQLRTGILHLGETNIMFLFGNYRDTPDIICVFVFHLDFPYPKSMPKLTWPKKEVSVYCTTAHLFLFCVHVSVQDVHEIEMIPCRGGGQKRKEKICVKQIIEECCKGYCFESRSNPLVCKNYF